MGHLYEKLLYLFNVMVSPNAENEEQSKHQKIITKKAHLVALYATSLVFTTVLCVVNAISIMRCIQYGNEVLYICWNKLLE